MDRYDALSMMRRVWNLLDQESLVVEAGIKISGPFYFHFYISVLNLHPAADPRNRFLDVHATPTHRIYTTSAAPAHVKRMVDG
jgi:hypothetical protein